MRYFNYIFFLIELKFYIIIFTLAMGYGDIFGYMQILYIIGITAFTPS